MIDNTVDNLHFRPEEFSDTTAASGSTQDSIPDDMLPPSDTDSDASDTDELAQICNPNRQERLHEQISIEDSNNSDNSDTERK